VNLFGPSFEFLDDEDDDLDEDDPDLDNEDEL
jgi:hypothetical protein